MTSIEVQLPGQSYPIHIGHGTTESHLPELVRKLARELVVIITNTTIHQLYPDKITSALKDLPYRVETIIVPDGEQYKTLDTLNTIYNKLMELHANRSTLILAFGGGVVGDMAGFAAATFMRGVPLLQVPTTLLSHVDSSVGGKTAVNHPLGKNTIGAFKQPGGVVIDVGFLATLPPRELKAGAFELIKHGFIRDKALLDFLKTNLSALSGHDWEFWEEAVARSCQVKAGVVETDEKEAGLRAILNFGHSLGHLIETHTHYTQYLHGEAVGVGMFYAAYASREMGHIDAATFDEVREILEPLLVPVSLPPLSQANFHDLLMHDKKASEQTLKFILLQGIGDAFIREKTTSDELWPLFKSFSEVFPGIIQFQP